MASMAGNVFSGTAHFAMRDGLVMGSTRWLRRRGRSLGEKGHGGKGLNNKHSRRKNPTMLDGGTKIMCWAAHVTAPPVPTRPVCRDLNVCPRLCNIKLPPKKIHARLGLLNTPSSRILLGGWRTDWANESHVDRHGNLEARSATLRDGE